MRFIAHQDSIDEWGAGAAGACCLDWTSSSLAWGVEGRPDVRPCSEEVKSLEGNVPQEEVGTTEKNDKASETPSSLKTLKTLKSLKSLLSKRKK